MSELPEHVRVNREHWDKVAPEWVERGRRSWAGEPAWGIWQVPETALRLLPDDMNGMDAIELGCGTAYASAWMSRRGARVTGVDNSAAQLETAARLAAEHGVALDLLHGNAEAVPLPDAHFDFALSEYGAAIWADPYRWIPEAWRLLRPGGRLVFLGSSPLSALCAPKDGSLPCTERLERDYFDLHRLDWRDAVDEPGGIEFALPLSGWFALFRQVGFEVEDYLEPRPEAGGDRVAFSFTADWARRFPSEQVFKLRKPRP